MRKPHLLRSFGIYGRHNPRAPTQAFIGELLCTCCVAGRRTPRGRESKRMAALVTE
jgi:hypothetical protein